MLFLSYVGLLMSFFHFVIVDNIITVMDKDYNSLTSGVYYLLV